MDSEYIRKKYFSDNTEKNLEDIQSRFSKEDIRSLLYADPYYASITKKANGKVVFKFDNEILTDSKWSGHRKIHDSFDSKGPMYVLIENAHGAIKWASSFENVDELKQYKKDAQ